MFRFLFRLFALFGFVVLVAVGVGGFVLYKALFPVSDIPATIVLLIDLDQKMAEQSSGDSVSGELLGGRTSLRDVIDALDRGASDPRVKGAVLRLGDDGVGMAQAQDVRAALARFRVAGKFTTAYANSFGEFEPGNQSYYLASACDQVWLQPVGLVGLTGLSAEMPFARKILDQYHILPEIEHREEYKSATETLTEPTMSRPHREMLESLLDDMTGQLVDGLSASRKLEPAVVRRLIDNGPFVDREAKEAGLIDRIGYYDELVDETLDKAGGDSDLVTPDDYLDVAGEPHESGPTIALIFVVGGIERGSGGMNPMLGGETVGSDAVVSAFQEAMDDDDVRAILLRIDSPGGSVVASETIRRAVLQAKAAGKPVIVSMSDTAASGGYWIAMDADRIIAEPATLTGSIGVIVGKVATGGFWDSLGVSWDSVKRGQNAGIWSNINGYSPSERARVTAITDDIYATFTRNVAEARHLSADRVREIARGRVWTGQQALKLGLVDELGDLDLALRRTREAIGLAADAPVSLDVYPRPRSGIERLAELISNGAAGVRATIQAVAPVARVAAPLVHSGRELRMSPTGLTP